MLTRVLTGERHIAENHDARGEGVDSHAPLHGAHFMQREVMVRRTLQQVENVRHRRQSSYRLCAGSRRPVVCVCCTLTTQRGKNSHWQFRWRGDDVGTACCDRIDKHRIKLRGLRRLHGTQPTQRFDCLQSLCTVDAHARQHHADGGFVLIAGKR